jgi:hypothetical protein
MIMKLSKIHLGHQLHQVVKRNQHFGISLKHRHQISGTEMVPKMLVSFDHLIWLMAHEDFIESIEI